MAEFKDWRQEKAVIETKRAYDEAGVAVSAIEAEHQAARANLRTAEQTLTLAEQELAANRGTLASVAGARAQVTRHRQTVDDLVDNSQATYATLEGAKAAYERACHDAKAKHWPAAVAEYRRAAVEFDTALERAIAAQEDVEELQQELGAQYGHTVDGWILAPTGERIGNASYGIRRLKRDAFENWRAWLEQSGVFAAQKAKKALNEAVDALRAMAGA